MTPDRREIERQAQIKRRARTAELDKIIRPLPASAYSVNYGLGQLDEMLEWLGKNSSPLEQQAFPRPEIAVEMTPDFQRGHVWTEKQQTAFIESFIRGLINKDMLTIQFNSPNWGGDMRHDSDLPCNAQCIDGLQRFTAIQRFMRGEIRPFGLDRQDLVGSSYEVNRVRWSMTLVVFSHQYKADLLSHYLALNEGGTPHTDAELSRVKAMLAEAQSNVEGSARPDTCDTISSDDATMPDRDSESEDTPHTPSANGSDAPL